ncbi:IS110 family transposase [Limosilactobacillus sp.]|jgi:transposase|uniref:IS110 family transposase n=1 Tax=Limosilactobacillus sp. TaxID=2773925 RepID=UPI0025C26FE1|nr:IS110 family transposase [Limosilactobacillus sp.]MCH3922236.1 IS110 family transposase [Limosilactobacillus sp.]MCH3923251.1 IS110 family transposase [Limosilactobacillus sp.]MCH3927933.1 IS110 family transposase [Limosilactobacillus sp.]MCH3929008.1 IS110 family transposase [Limosilactobacillus sp.]
MRCVFGIDVSSKTCNVAVVVNEHLVDEAKLSLDMVGFNQLKAALDAYTDPEVVFEATGVYSRRLERFLTDNGYQFVRLNPLQARIELTSFRYNKTDVNDAQNLAYSSFYRHHRLTSPEAPVYQNLRDLNRFYQNVTNDVVRLKNRLHKILQLTFPELEQLLSVTDGEFYWQIVVHYAHPSFVLLESEKQIITFLASVSKKKVTSVYLQRIAHRLVGLSKQAYPAVTADSPKVMELCYYAQQLIDGNQQKAALIEQMVAIAKELPEFQNLISIPGFGETTVVTLIAEFGDIRRFKSSNAMNAFVGIDFRHYESGKFVAKDTISKRGNAIARKLLYKAVLNCVIASHYHPNHIGDFYQKRKKQSSSPQTKKIAISAIHRLIRTMYHLVKNDQFYDYSKTHINR